MTDVLTITCLADFCGWTARASSWATVDRLARAHSLAGTEHVVEVTTLEQLSLFDGLDR